MNKIAFGRIIDKCLITTGLNYLTNFDLKVFLRQVPKLHHYTGPKNWCNFGTWCNLGWCNLGVTTVYKSSDHSFINNGLMNSTFDEFLPSSFIIFTILTVIK